MARGSAPPRGRCYGWRVRSGPVRAEGERDGSASGRDRQVQENRDRGGTGAGWEHREASVQEYGGNQGQGVTPGEVGPGRCPGGLGGEEFRSRGFGGGSSQVREGVPGYRGGVSRCCTRRMCAGSALRQEHRQDYGQELRQEFHREYRRSLEREFGPAGTCPGPAVAEQLRQRLQQEPALLEALQEDALALLARGLRDHPDPGLALRGLASAFRLLELAAVNLYLFPWRREFGTIPVRPRGGEGMVLGYPDTLSHAPCSPCRPSPAPMCTCCARRSPKPTCCGV